MDYERALVKVEEYSRCARPAFGIGEYLGARYGVTPQWQDCDRQLVEGLPLIEAIAREVNPLLGGATSCG